MFRGAAQASFKGYQKYDLQLNLPGLANNNLFFDFYSAHRNYPGINYYGPGPDSTKGSRSAFRLEDTAFDGTFGIRPLSHLHVGASLGYLLVNVGPGTDTRFVSAEKVFTPVESPGIDRQANFLRHGVFAQFDYRDNPGGPRSGGNYIVEYSRSIDRSLNLHDFQRLTLHLQQYIPLFNKRRVFALRGKSVLTFKEDDQKVYLVRETKGTKDQFKLRGSEWAKIQCGHAHFDALGVDFAHVTNAGEV